MAASTAPAAHERSRLRPILTAGAAVLGATALLNARNTSIAEHRHRPQGDMIDVDGVPVHVLRAGRTSAPTVLLLHGNGATLADWLISGVFQRLTDDFHVVAVDRPGFGHSGRPRNRSWTARTEAHHHRRTMARLSLPRPIVVGHSRGTQPALAMAIDRPRGVRGLVLMSGYYFPTARLDAVAFGPQALPVVGDVWRHTLSPPLSRLSGPAFIARMFAPRPVTRRFQAEYPLDLAVRPSQLRAFGADSARLVPDAADLSRHYHELGLPMAILAGLEDRIVSASGQAERLADAIPHARLSLFEGEGHMFHHDLPDAVVAAVRDVAAEADASFMP